MRIIGLDYGEARIGVAVSDILETIANPLDTICEKDREKQLEKVLDVIKSERAEKIVVGLPKRMDGTMGHRAEYGVRLFGAGLPSVYGEMLLRTEAIPP